MDAVLRTPLAMNANGFVHSWPLGTKQRPSASGNSSVRCPGACVRAYRFLSKACHSVRVGAPWAAVEESYVRFNKEMVDAWKDGDIHKPDSLVLELNCLYSTSKD